MNALTALLGKKSAGTASSWLVTSNGVIAGIVGETSWPQAGGGSIGGGTSSGGSSGGTGCGTPSPETPGVVASTVANRAETPLIDLIAAGAVIEAAIESADADYGTADDALRLGTPLSRPLMKSSARTVPTPCLQRFPSSLSPSTRI